MTSSQNYQIHISGLLDCSWSDWFDSSTIYHLNGDTTVLTGELPDQAALHGILNKIRDLGLILLKVVVEPADQDVPDRA